MKKFMKPDEMKPVATIQTEDGKTATVNILMNATWDRYDVIATTPNEDPEEPDDWEILAENFETEDEAADAVKRMYDNGNWGIEYL